MPLWSEGILQTGSLAWNAVTQEPLWLSNHFPTELVSSEVDYTFQGDKPHTQADAAVPDLKEIPQAFVTICHLIRNS